MRYLGGDKKNLPTIVLEDGEARLLAMIIEGRVAIVVGPIDADPRELEMLQLSDEQLTELRNFLAGVKQ